MMIKLLPCPFCGSEYADVLLWHIECSDCGASVRNLTPEELTTLPTTTEKCERMASIWNRQVFGINEIVDIV